jgi:colanic acid/amylovoran biosynthesis glycosyltransferase
LVKRGHPLRLRLIGDGGDRIRLERQVQQQGLIPMVVFEGARSHDATRKLLASADIFVLPSFAEGLPVALMEAMAMEIPCISTYVGGIPELIRHGEDGLLVPASSADALAEAMERLILSPELRRALAASGRRRVLERYDLRQNVGSLAAALRKRIG